MSYHEGPGRSGYEEGHRSRQGKARPPPALFVSSERQVQGVVVAVGGKTSVEFEEIRPAVGLG